MITKNNQPCAIDYTIDAAGVAIPAKAGQAPELFRRAPNGSNPLAAPRHRAKRIIRNTLETVDRFRGSLLDSWDKLKPLMEPGALALLPVKGGSPVNARE